jgi:hypothetical protein
LISPNSPQTLTTFPVTKYGLYQMFNFLCDAAE